MDKMNEQVEMTAGCWRWLGGHSNGRPMFFEVAPYNEGKRKGTYVYRLMWEQANGPVPDNLTLDHLCSNIWCIRPSHLEAVSRGENTRRANASREIGRASCRERV